MRNENLSKNIGTLHTTAKRVFTYKINGRNRVLEYSFAKSIDAALVEAILQADTKKVSDAIKQGADVNAEESNVEKKSPIHFAIIQPNPEVIEILYQQKANLQKLRSDKFKVSSTISLPLSHRHPLLMCLNLSEPSNKVIARALLKHMMPIEKQDWYPQETKYHAKIAKLRMENSEDEEKKEQATQVSPDEINRLFYRLKVTFLHNKCLLASASLVGFFILFTNLTFASSFTITASTFSIAFGIQYFSYLGLEDPNYYLDPNDIRKGIEFAWNKGIIEAIELVYNAARYENPNEYREYNYTPGVTVSAAIARTL